MTTQRLICMGLFLLLIVAAPNAPAAEKVKQTPRVAKTTGTPVLTYFDINNISTVLRNDGTADIDPGEQNSGLVFPKGSAKTACFQSGFLWGGIIGGEVRVGGTTYRTGLQPGKMTSPGVHEDPNLPKNRIYRVRRDVFPGGPSVDLSSDARNEGNSADAIRAQYEADWTEWPVGDGAPFDDKNHNGTYEPGIDVPGVPGADQTIWFVANDDNPGATTNLYGSTPMGIELQVTVWGYSQQGALGNMLFKKYLIINKGASSIDSMYVSQWADVDLGNSTDDFSGCDTSLSLGYTYNAFPNDATYDPLPPPVTGFDFFQGPVVSAPGDSGIFKGSRIYDKKNLPMTAFYYFARGDASVTDPALGSYSEGTLRFYNFIRGRIGLTGQYFQDPNTGNPTPFALAGDPVTGTGWVDGNPIVAGDRRMGLASGPFTMAVGDTQEVVVAEICAGAIPGVSNIGCISLLRFFDKSAQLAYDNFFNVPAAPPAPKVVASEYDKEVVLTWGADPVAINNTESSNNGGFVFQGYNVYQLPGISATKDQGKRIATYDVKDGIGIIRDQVFDASTGALVEQVAQVGPDQGISRSITITSDAVRGGVPMVNGIRYFYAVTAYSYNPDPNVVPNNLENPLAIITVTPHLPNPGVRYQAAGGDTVAGVRHVAVGGPLSEGFILPIVVDPARVTGHTYQVVFDTAGGLFHWNLRDSTANSIVVADLTNQSGDANYPITDGIQVRVSGPPPGMKDWTIPSGARKWTFANADGFALEGFNGAMGMGYNNWFSSSSVTPDHLHNVLIKLAATDSLGNLLDPNDTTASNGYRYMRSAGSPPARPEFAPFIVNPTPGEYAYQDYRTRNVPFAAYDLENGGQRLMVGFLEDNQIGGRVDGKYWPDTQNGPYSNTDAAGPREWAFIFSVPYSTTPDPSLTVDILNVETPMMWWILANRRYVDHEPTFDAGDEFEILANHPNTMADVFTFTAPSVTRSPALAREDVKAITVFPNPYYAINTEEINKYQRFVTFSHLPDNATIRIFNLAGILVRTIQKNTAGQFQRWDLANRDGLPVASGVYIAYIEMPDLGVTKIVKFSVIQERQFLDRF